MDSLATLTESRKSLGILTGSMVWVFGLSIGSAQATDISGTISMTKTITTDSRLVRDVICTVTGAPCIKFGADEITLDLNGFTMTGKANPIVGCDGAGPTPGEDGISTNDKSFVLITGPGLVRGFRNHGINVTESTTYSQVRQLASSTNCHNGIQLSGSNDTVLSTAAVRNCSITNTNCGGIEVRGSNSQVLSNWTHGNGLVFNGSTGSEDDFGIGVYSNSNFIDLNYIGGNSTSGIVIFPGASGNTFEEDVVLGNPPIQTSVSFSPSPHPPPFFNGYDIRNESSGPNTFSNPICETDTGSTPALCPNVSNLSSF